MDKQKPSQNKTVLVTGGAGFIGSNFIRYMVKKYPHYNFINLDALTYAGNLQSLNDIEGKANYQFIKGSITDKEVVNIILQPGVDYIVNFAAESHVDRSIEGPEIFFQTNVLGTLVLLEAIRKYRVEKFVQVSTDEVYGSLGPTGYFTESSPLAPNSPYAASKASADLMVNAYYKTFGLVVNITRCSNNYGPYQFPEKLIPLFVINTFNNNSLPLYGDGLNIRDWLHVKDHCRAIDLVLHRGSTGEVYNIGGNSEKTNSEITKFILKTLGKSESLISYVKDRPGHDRRYAIDSTKIKTELGWHPEYSFEQGLTETIRWYLKNREWWEPIWLSRGSYD
ncbi:MAG: dTDP-glucose 4,6-dehydratase [Firmicutes bacterium]|nr:dTDP-glucose 4,6-dehydratase [Bacillota bacterium]